MVAWVHYFDPVVLRVDNAPAGENWYDNRAEWHGPTTINLTDGGLTGTQWYRDVGPIGMAEELLEPRAFCYRGGCNFTFTGRTLIIRLNVAWTWYRFATLRIDGQVPSTMGLLTAVDLLTCDSADYIGMLGDGYVDVLVADGLPNATHLVEIVIDNADPAQFFSIAGYKVGQLPTRPTLCHDAAIVSETIPPNAMQLTITNRKTDPVANIGIAWPPTLKKADGSALTPFYQEHLAGGDSIILDFAPILVAAQASGIYEHTLALSVHYPDPDSSDFLDIVTIIFADSDILVFDPGPWIIDNATPDGRARRFAYARYNLGVPWSMSFTFEGDEIHISTQCAAGWGLCGIYADAACTVLLATYDCGLPEGSQIHVFLISGFGPGDHTVYFCKVVDDPLPVIFVAAAWTEAQPYTQVNESVVLRIPCKQPIPMPVVDVVVGTYDATFDPPVLTDHHYETAPVRTNANVVATETLHRFPTFAVFYGTGFRDLLCEYDVLILDPIGAKTEDVEYWQSKGIKCYGYVATLEEIGFYEDRYDFASPIRPRKDGTGPGGYSSNYMFTKFATTGEPDRNGVWASFYMDPRAASGWVDRTMDYYVPQCFGGSVVVTDEPVVAKAVTISTGPRIVFDVVQVPINASREIVVRTADHSHTYQRYRDYTYDIKTGAFVMATNALPAVVAGQTLHVSYTRKGHNFDGIFLDVVDDVDIYLSTDWGFEYVPGHAEATTAMINGMKAAYPTKGFISNRGFSILDDIIHSCDGVMFESWLTLPTVPGPWSPATEYYIVADQPTVDFNEAFNQQLRRLRRIQVFDVYSMNYARNDPADDHLREYCKRKDAEYGYSSWVTVITLNDPTHNSNINIGLPHVQSSLFTRYKVKGV